MLPDIIPHIIAATILLCLPSRHILWSFPSLTLIKVPCFRHSSTSFHHIATLLRRDLTVVAGPGDFAAVLGGAAWEAVGYALIDSRLIGWEMLVVVKVWKWVSMGTDCLYFRHRLSCLRSLCRPGRQICVRGSLGLVLLWRRCRVCLGLRRFVTW
jgi:hypothetical protein